RSSSPSSRSCCSPASLHSFPTRRSSDLELVQGASHAFDLDEYRAGRLSPVFFGSAVNNFGVQPLLDFFVRHAPPPQPRATTTREDRKSTRLNSSHVSISYAVFCLQQKTN